MIFFQRYSFISNASLTLTNCNFWGITRYYIDLGPMTTSSVSRGCLWSHKKMQICKFDCSFEYYSGIVHIRIFFPNFIFSIYFYASFLWHLQCIVSKYGIYYIIKLKVDLFALKTIAFYGDFIVITICNKSTRRISSK